MCPPCYQHNGFVARHCLELIALFSWLHKYTYTYVHIYGIMKMMCRPGYHHNCFMATHALGYLMYGYTLLVPVNQRVLNKLSKEPNVSSHKWSTTHRVLNTVFSSLLFIIVKEPIIQKNYPVVHKWLNHYSRHI